MSNYVFTTYVRATKTIELSLELKIEAESISAVHDEISRRLENGEIASEQFEDAEQHTVDLSIGPVGVVEPANYAGPHPRSTAREP